jgi:hypothetical protein
MERDFRPKLFIEGSQTPQEEPPYWRLMRGEEVPLGVIQQQSFLYVEAVNRMIDEGMVQSEVRVIDGQERSFLSLKYFNSPWCQLKRPLAKDGS